jgi:hypothetical protein
MRDEDFVQTVDESEEICFEDSVGGEGGWVGAGEGAGEGGVEGFVGFWGLLGVVWWSEDLGLDLDPGDLTRYHAWEGGGAR